MSPMLRPPSSPSECVDSATLAAFVDGMLEPADRVRVVAHLGSCADCAELVGEVVRTTDELAASEPAKVKVLWMRRRGLVVAGGIAAIAASLLLFVLTRSSALDPLVGVVGNERLIVARPTGGFHYGPLRSPTRGAGETRSLRLVAEAARLRERAAQTNTATDLHASGVAQLVSGDTAAAIESLQSAARLEPSNATFMADLGAAYMTRFLDREDPSDGAAALDAFDKALALSPSLREARFNRALLLDRLNRPADALAAWDKYLELSDDPGWHAEAERNRSAVQQRVR